LNNVFISVLSQEGVQVFQPTPTPEAPESRPLSLEFRAITFSLAYTDVYRSWLIGGKKVKRRADIRLMVTLTDTTNGAVVWVGEGVRAHSDAFAHKNLPIVEEGSFTFTRPAIPSSGWGKLAEPVLVGGIIVGLVYLFFSNQSDN